MTSLSEPPPDADSVACRHEVAVQQSRAMVYTFATCIAVVVKSLGALDVTWAAIGGFFLLATLSALVFGWLFARGRQRVLGVPLQPLWMAFDVGCITLQVYLSGGSESTWFPWYLANTAAAAFVAGQAGMLSVMAGNVAAYLGLVVATETPTVAVLGQVVGKMLVIYGAAYYALLGIARLQEKRRLVAQLKDEESRRAGELQRMAKQLEEREERFRSLTETAASAIFVLQGERLCYVNRAAEEISGYTRDELLAMDFLETVHPAFEEAVRQQARARQEHELPPVRFELKMRHQGGGWRWLDLTAGSVRYDGRPAVIGAAFDITAQKRAARALQESERALTTLFSNLQGMAYRCANDPDWTMEFVSEGCLELTGYQAADLVGNATVSYGELIHPDDREQVWNTVQAAVDADEPFELVYRIRAADGEERWVWERGRGVRSAKGELVALEGFISDITRERRVEQELRQAQKMQAIGHLAGGVAHDFNNLLMAIQGSSELLQRRLAAGDASHQELEVIQRAVTRAAELTHGLLAFARRQVLQQENLDLRQLVRDMLPILRRVIPESITVATGLGSEPVTVHADRGQLEQVVMNLCLNARDAMPTGGDLTVEVSSIDADEVSAVGLPGDHGTRFALLAVRDTGLGMDQETLARVFEPFFTTKDSARHSGLGLATVYGIVRQHHGEVEVSSQPGGGTELGVYLPQVESAVVTVASPQRPSPTGGHETLLVVEDDDAVRGVLVSVLGGLGYAVVSSSDGAEALEVLRRGEPEVALVITDVVMPRMGGRELREAAKRVAPQVRFLFSSGYATDALGERTELEPGVSFITKPYSVDVLASAVRHALAASL